MRTLLGHHLGLKGQVQQLLDAGDARATELKDLVDDYLQGDLLKPSGLYQFFPAQADGDDVVKRKLNDLPSRVSRLNRFYV